MKHLKQDFEKKMKKNGEAFSVNGFYAYIWNLQEKLI